jgi:glycosyltransferase involved in cell wall biosynthesis
MDSFDPDRYNLRCFFFDDRWQHLLPPRFEKIYIRRGLIKRALGYLIKWLIRTPAGWRFSGRFSDSAKAINASDCDSVIYPGQDILAYQTNKKSIVAIHDLMYRYESHFEEYQGQECAKRDVHYSSICKYADLILVDSLIGKKHVLESYPVEDQKVQILPFAPPFYLLEANLINIRIKYSLPEKFIFYPAQFWAHKNHINLLRAVKHLKDSGEEINLVLVGAKKNNYFATMKKIDQLGLSENVFVLGYVSNEEMYSLYKSAVAMVFVSLIGPTNIPPMEALVTGCPLVCSSVYAMPDQVGDAALLVDPTDPFDMAEKIKLVWNDADIRNRLVTSGLQQANKYGQADVARRLSYYVNQVVAYGDGAQF